jgi:hypothetical protein
MGPESVFYPDWMQPDWLPNRRQQWLATTGLGLAVALAAGLTIGLTIWLAFWPILPSALFGGDCRRAGRSRRVCSPCSRIEPVEQLRWSWRAEPATNNAI